MRHSRVAVAFLAPVALLLAEAKTDPRVAAAQKALAEYEASLVSKRQPESLKKHLFAVRDALSKARGLEKKIEAGLLMGRLAFHLDYTAMLQQGTKAAIDAARQLPEEDQIDILRRKITEAAAHRRYSYGLNGGFIERLKELSDDESVERFADYHKALFSVASHDTSEARSLFRELLSEGARDSWAEKASYQLGMMEADLRNYSRAIRQFQSFLSQFPKSKLVPAAQHALAMNYYSQGYKFVALSYCQDLLKKYPESDFAGASRLLIEKIKIEVLQGTDPF